MDTSLQTTSALDPVLNAFAAALAPYVAAHLQKAIAAPAEENTELLTQQQAAAFLNCNVNTLIKWGKAGQVNPLKKGSRVYYRKADLLNFNSGAKS